MCLLALLLQACTTVGSAGGLGREEALQRWYDAVYEQASETALEEAEKAALREVRMLLARLA